MKPRAPSCDRNRDVILAVLRAHLPEAAPGAVLEIGSGTGQHAVYFTEQWPGLRWQCSDREEALAGIRMWLDEAARPDVLLHPLQLDVGQPDWPSACAGVCFDTVFTANTLHIMGWPQVESFFRGLPQVLAPGGRLVVYGPFNFGGRFTSESNAAFDGWLKARDPVSGIRDFEAVNALALAAGLHLVADVEMPAHNRTLVWQRADGSFRDQTIRSSTVEILPIGS